MNRKSREVLLGRRLNYFSGRLLTAEDLKEEQTYHLNKRRLHNLALHDWGVVVGLDVSISIRWDFGCIDSCEFIYLQHIFSSSARYVVWDLKLDCMRPFRYVKLATRFTWCIAIDSSWNSPGRISIHRVSGGKKYLPELC